MRSELARKKEDDKMIENFVHGTYTDDFRSLVYCLREHHVSISHIGPVIKAVVSYCGKELKKLPCDATISLMTKEQMSAAHQKISEQVVGKDDTT